MIFVSGWCTQLAAELHHNQCGFCNDLMSAILCCRQDTACCPAGLGVFSIEWHLTHALAGPSQERAALEAVLRLHIVWLTQCPAAVGAFAGSTHRLTSLATFAASQCAPADCGLHTMSARGRTQHA